MASHIGSATHSTLYQPGVAIAAAFATGIVLDGCFDLPVAWLLVFGAGTLVLYAVCRLTTTKWAAINMQAADRWLATSARSGAKWLTPELLILAMAVGVVGAFWHHFHWNAYPKNHVYHWASDTPQPVCARLTLLSEPRSLAPPDRSEFFDRPIDDLRMCRFLANCNAIRTGKHWIPASGKCYVKLPMEPNQLRPGDQIQLVGKFVRPDGPRNPGQYNFQNHYRRQRVLTQFFCYHQAAVHRIPQQRTNRAGRVSNWRSRMRSYLNQLSWRYLPPAQASFAAAILLGNREQLGESRRAKFLQSGTVHLLAISGLHVGILAGCFLLLFHLGAVERNTSLLLTILFVLFYAWLVEFRPPVLRATILIVLMCIARMLGRSALSYNVLALAAIIVFLINPADVFAIGAQLSFLAVIAIIFGNRAVFNHHQDPLTQLIESQSPPPVQAWMKFVGLIRTSVAISGLIWLISIPLVAYYFHLLTPISLITNPILLFPIAIALYAGFGLFLLGEYASWLAAAAAALCGAMLGACESIVGLASGVTAGHFWVSGPPWPAVVAFYLGWLIWGIFPATRVETKKLYCMGAVWLALGWWLPNQWVQWQRVLGGNLTVTLVDVGHGTAAVIEMPCGQTMLYDGGSASSSKYALDMISATLWHKRISQIDAVIVSHADIDHFNAIPKLCERFSIKRIMMSPMMLCHQSESAQQFQSVLNQRQVTIETISQGQAIDFAGGANVAVLAPDLTLTHANDNSSSIVLKIQYRGRTVLLPGDLEDQGMEGLLNLPPIDCDLVMAPHHGSRNSRPAEFLRWASPQFVAVSCGAGKLTAPVRRQFTAQHARLKCTADDGAIQFQIDKNGDMKFTSFRN